MYHLVLSFIRTKLEELKTEITSYKSIEKNNNRKTNILKLLESIQTNNSHILSTISFKLSEYRDEDFPDNKSKIVANMNYQNSKLVLLLEEKDEIISMREAKIKDLELFYKPFANNPILEMEVGKLKEEIFRLKNQINENKDLVQEARKIQKEYKDLWSNYENLSLNYKCSQESYDALHLDLFNLKTIIDNNNKEIEELNNNICKLQQSAIHAKEYEHKLNSLLISEKEGEKRGEITTKELGKLHKFVESKNNIIEDLLCKINTLEMQLDGLTAENKSLSSTVTLQKKELLSSSEELLLSIDSKKLIEKQKDTIRLLNTSILKFKEASGHTPVNALFDATKKEANNIQTLKLRNDIISARKEVENISGELISTMSSIIVILIISDLRKITYRSQNKVHKG